MRQFLDEAHNVVAEIPDDTPPEISELRHVGRGAVSEHREISERIRWPPRIVPASDVVPVFHDTVQEPPGAARL